MFSVTLIFAMISVRQPENFNHSAALFANCHCDLTSVGTRRECTLGTRGLNLGYSCTDKFM